MQWNLYQDTLQSNFWKLKTKKKIWKKIKSKTLISLQAKKKNLSDSKFLIRNYEARRKCDNTFQLLKERTVNKEFYMQWKYPSGMKGESRHSQMDKN